MVSAGSHQLATSVSDTNVTAVQVGDAATVTLSASSGPLSGGGGGGEAKATLTGLAEFVDHPPR